MPAKKPIVNNPHPSVVSRIHHFLLLPVVPTLSQSVPVPQNACYSVEMEEMITHRTRCRRCRFLALVDSEAGLAEVYAAKHDQITETVLGPGVRSLTCICAM